MTGESSLPDRRAKEDLLAKDAGRVRNGNTSSESSNSVPSSPVHHKSLEDQDTESQSNNSAQEPEKTHPAKGIGGKAVAMVNPLVAEPQNILQSPSVLELALTCLPYALQYNPTHRDTNEGKITITILLAREFWNHGDADFIFQQDLAPAHTAKGTKSWFNDHGGTVLDWPANPPDLNPIENLWGIVKRKMRDTRPNNADDLKAAIKATYSP
ncbi:Transposable element Tc1 transposase [Triplophysa rosa]|uniref:Transposable element Tc1 transposase n=1 Tax=Triplophysa rosa TaxID=992332 RepID=A0A9W7T2M3_TRIRA|nr:Transposable element Tc1 transposase [Triplophysa rosa]